MIFEINIWDINPSLTAENTLVFKKFKPPPTVALGYYTRSKPYYNPRRKKFP